MLFDPALHDLQEQPMSTWWRSQNVSNSAALVMHNICVAHVHDKLQYTAGDQVGQCGDRITVIDAATHMSASCARN